MISRTVLLVDDDVITQWVMAEALTEAGCDVVSACRGAEASNLLTEQSGFDLLVTDVDLPDGLTGIDLAHLWRQAMPGRPVLYIATERRAAVQHLGPNEWFLAKPFTPDMLLDAVELALHEATVSPPRLPASLNCYVN